MRAREYADRYLKDPTPEALCKVAWDMLMETKQLSVSRHASSTLAILSILSEVDTKWRAFVRRVGDPGIQEDGLTLLIKDRVPFIYPYWMQYKEAMKR